MLTINRSIGICIGLIGVIGIIVLIKNGYCPEQNSSLAEKHDTIKPGAKKCPKFIMDKLLKKLTHKN